MAEYVYAEDQAVLANENVLLQDSIPCNRGYVVHRNGSGILTLRGIVNNPCASFALPGAGHRRRTASDV